MSGCAQAVQEREDALRAEQLTYTDATFHVELVQQSDVTGSATAFTGEHLPLLLIISPSARPSLVALSHFHASLGELETVFLEALHKVHAKTGHNNLPVECPVTSFWS